MVEIRRGSEGMGSGDRLPWLEPVEDEDDGYYSPHGEEPSGGYGGVMLAALGVLIAIALITAGVVWFRHHRAANADIGDVIHPDPGPYKEKPANTGGLATDETGQVASSTSAGQDIDSALDLNAVPEQPVVTRAKPAAQTPQPAPHQPQPKATIPQQAVSSAPAIVVPAPVKAPPAAPPPTVVKPPATKAPPAVKEEPVVKEPPKAKVIPVTPPADKPAAAGGTVQLGAFSTEAKANAVWKSLSSRFHYLADMTPIVLPVESGDTKLFRLRATGGSTPGAQVCGQLRVAGETCAVIGK